MITLTVTARGQITFPKKALRHLGVVPGEMVELELLPDGRAQLKAVPQKWPLRALHGVLKGKTNGKVLCLDDIDRGISEASAAAGGRPTLPD